MSPKSSVMTEDELQQITLLLGPWLIGCFIDLFLQGALSSQFIKYLSWRHEDTIGTQLAVAGLAILTFLKSVHNAAIVWIIFVLHFKDLEGALALSYTAWWQTCNSVVVATIGVYVQIFFCHRLWVISKRNIWYVLPIGAVLSFAYISSCLATYHISTAKGFNADEVISMWFAAHLSSVFAGDLMLTVSTAFLLLRYRRDVLPHTLGVIHSLVRLTFQTIAPASLCAMINLILSQVYTSQATLIPVAINLALPKLYAFSMIWTLNARRSIRTDFVKPISHGGVSLSMRIRPNDVELSTSSPRIEVHKQTNVKRHLETV